jgi:hypothetical protein
MKFYNFSLVFIADLKKRVIKGVKSIFLIDCKPFKYTTDIYKK